MLANANIISCNLSSFTSHTLKHPKLKTSLQSQNLKPRISSLKTAPKFSAFLKPQNHTSSILAFRKKGLIQTCHGTLTNQNSEDPVVEKGDSLEGGVGGSGNGGEGRNWTTSILLLVLWGALMYYVVNLTPNQTPSRDMYFLQKLLNLKGDDGFRMNEVLVSLWYIMGLWPLVYSMLLLPTGRSSKSNIPVWPFLILSCFGGAYALLPYFVVWKPPPPPVEETEIRRWPLNFLESKLTAGVRNLF
ncbi:Cardiolipin synthase N-terminal [Fagus crenata]